MKKEDEMKEVIVIKARKNNFDIKIDIDGVLIKNLVPLVGSLNHIIHRLNDLILRGDKK